MVCYDRFQGLPEDYEVKEKEVDEDELYDKRVDKELIKDKGSN